MSVENITANILSDAKQIAEVSLANAEKSKEEIINKAKYDAEAIRQAAREKVNKDAENLKSRKLSAAELQGRKMMLGAKQDAIKKSFDEALKKLSAMPEDQYIEFLTKEITNVPYSEGTIILNKKDREKIGEKLVKAVNDKLKAEKFTLSNETVNSQGGFVLKSGAIMINSTYETILNSIKDELTNEVANALFK
jgi:V/A-type H+-transporting ATPase subunit E